MGQSKLLMMAGWMLLPWALLLLGHAEAQEAGVGHFYFIWPALTYQCETINLQWSNATPPFSFWILPMGGQPFMYEIPDSAYVDGEGSYPLNYGTNYITMMSDANGIGSGGTGEIQQTGSSPSTGCLNTFSQNVTTQDFSFSVAGVAEQCNSGFQLQWNAADNLDPVNFTVLPLDQGFFPFDVRVDNTDTYINSWNMNLTEGTRFSIMMNDKNGYGRGGIAGIYEVDGSNNSACIATQTQVSSETGTWPVGIATNTLASATLPPDRHKTTSAISGGAIAGIVIGILAVVIGILVGIWWLIRRKRRRQEAEAKTKEDGEEMDLAGESTDYSNPAPDPYRDLSGYAAGSSTSTSQNLGLANRGAGMGGHEAFGGGVGGGGGGGSRSESFQSWNENNHLMPLDGSTTGGGASTAGFAGLGAGSRGPSTDQVRYSGDAYRDSYAGNMPYGRSDADILGEGEARDGPGVAGPLPTKSTQMGGGSALNRPLSGGFIVRNPTISTTASGTPSSQTKATQGHGGGGGPGAGSDVAVGMPVARPLPVPGRQVGAGGGGLRIANADEHDPLPSPIAAPSPRRPIRETQPRFRRHEDAGRVPLPHHDDEGDVVDLPPLYSDVPRDHEPIMRGPSATEDEVGEHHRTG